MLATSRTVENAEGERAERSSPPRRWIIAAVVLMAIGLLLTRFVVTRPEGAVLPPVSASSTAEVVTSLEARVSREPTDLAAWQELGASLVQAATETGDPAYYQRAEDAFAQATILDPDNPATAIGKAVLALARHDFAGAAELGAEVHQADSFNSEALVVMVDAEIELGRYELAAEHLQELLDLRPALPALTRTSYLRELYGDLPGAEQAMVQAITAGSRSLFDLAVTNTLLGDLYLKQGDLDRAEARYLDAQGLAPNLLTAGVGRARVAIAEGQFSEAAGLLEEVVDRFPEPGALALLGDVLTVMGRTDEAENAYATVSLITELQRNAGAKVDLELARFEADHGDVAEALMLAQLAYEDRPTVLAAEVLGWAHYQLGDAKSALGYVEESLRLGTRDAALLLHAAVILEANGEMSRAAELRTRASVLDPWYRVLHPELQG